MRLTEEQITRIMKEAPFRIKLIAVVQKAATLWVRIFLGPLPHDLQMKIFEKAWQMTRSLRRKMHNSMMKWMSKAAFWGPIE